MSEPVAWRVKDFADRWVYYTSAEAARGASYLMADALVQPLYAADRIEALEAERDRLQALLDSRPAINAALPESYIKWSQGIYAVEARAALSPTPER